MKSADIAIRGEWCVDDWSLNIDGWRLVDDQDRHDMYKVSIKNNALITKLSKRDKRIESLESELASYRQAVNNMSSELSKIKRREKRLNNKK